MEPMDEPSQKSDSLKDKFNKKLDDFQTEEKFGDLKQFAQNNIRDTIAYVILFTGILISLFRPFLGHSIIGIITGIYFSNEIGRFITSFNEWVEYLGTFRTFILAGATFGLFLTAPMFFIGLAAAIGLKILVLGIEKDNDS